MYLVYIQYSFRRGKKYERKNKINYNDNTFPIMERIETICFSEEGTGVIEYLEYVEDSGYESWLFQSFIYTIGEKQFNIFDFVIIIEKVDKETLVLSCNGVKKEFKRKK